MLICYVLPDTITMVGTAYIGAQSISFAYAVLAGIVWVGAKESDMKGLGAMHLLTVILFVTGLVVQLIIYRLINKMLFDRNLRKDYIQTGCVGQEKAKAKADAKAKKTSKNKAKQLERDIKGL